MLMLYGFLVCSQWQVMVMCSTSLLIAYSAIVSYIFQAC